MMMDGHIDEIGFLVSTILVVKYLCMYLMTFCFSNDATNNNYTVFFLFLGYLLLSEYSILQFKMPHTKEATGYGNWKTTRN